MPSKDANLQIMLHENDRKINDILKDLSVAKYTMDRSSILAITDQRGSILYVNDKFCEISKYSFEELRGKDHRILNSGFHPSSFFKEMWRTIGTGRIWQGEIQNKAKDGTRYWVDTTIVPFLNENGKPYQYVAIRNDITERKQVEDELKKSEEKYRLITENSFDLIATLDGEGKLLYVSPSFESTLGHEIQELENSNLLEWIHKNDHDDVINGILNVISTKETSPQLEFQLRTKEGNYLFVETRISPIITDSKEIHTLVLVMRDISERKKTEATIYHLAYHDTLTELPNRRFFMDFLRKEVYHANRNRSQMGVMYLDVDRFKNINDSRGHEAGDLILAETAKRIKKNLRPNDLVARIGGDEFTILMSDVSSKTEIEEVAQRIKDSFQHPIKLNNETYNLSCSIGISHYPDDGTEADALLKRADIALYVVKEKGRNGFKFFEPTMEKSSLERILLENELKKAIKLEQFYIDYQPKVTLATEKLIGMEALVRWNHPELGKIAPNKFIPIAEETGLIRELGEWVLRKGCEQAMQWQKLGYPPIKLSVNLSVNQFYQPDLVQVLKEALESTGLDPKWLELEVTESVFANLEKAVSIMDEIRELGVQTSIDDFGTGYSSLSYIKKLPIDTLKIDASFIQDIHLNKESQAIVKAIISIAETLQLNVIAEGVESKEQMNALNEDGCIQGQGFLFSKPLSSNEFEEFFKKAT